MAGSQFLYHKQKQKWALFEEDLKEFLANKEKYAGIFQRPETFVFGYRWKGRQVKVCQRLEDTYKFKLQWEKEHAG